jgi:hypothetical protein
MTNNLINIPLFYVQNFDKQFINEIIKEVQPQARVDINVYNRIDDKRIYKKCKEAIHNFQKLAEGVVQDGTMHTIKDFAAFANKQLDSLYVVGKFQGMITFVKDFYPNFSIDFNKQVLMTMDEKNITNIFNECISESLMTKKDFQYLRGLLKEKIILNDPLTSIIAYSNLFNAIDKTIEKIKENEKINSIQEKDKPEEIEI